MNEETNPYAFPHDKGPAGAIETGMTLRDYLAAKAMQAWIVAFSSNDNATHSIITDVGNYAYNTADAMLIERNKSTTKE